jgi:hypothetical protein
MAIIRPPCVYHVCYSSHNVLIEILVCAVTIYFFSVMLFNVPDERGGVMKVRTIISRISFLSLLFWMGASPSYAATYYVRPDGGTATQCTGTTDAAYPGSGTGRACAFNHPFWAIAPIGNNPTKMAGGDTLVIDGTSGTSYLIGYGAPNTTDTGKCYSAWPWDCQMRAIPSGPDAVHPTRILGKGWDSGCSKPPQLYGRERLRQVLNLTGSNNVELQCLNITDHSDCQDGGPKTCNRSTYPYGDWADWGIIAADSSNVLLKNVNIHGLAHGAINVGRIKDWTLDTVRLVANAFVGWDGDIGATTSSNSGTISFNKVTIAYNGCGETYPGLAPYNCFSQSQSGYGDGLGTAKTGGNWVFTNSNVSHNTSDGIDLLYHNGSGTITINRVKAEGNAGNQVKVATTTTIANSVIIGNCSFFRNNPITWNSSTFDNCRALGNSVSVDFKAGMKVSITNSTITSNGDNLILSSGVSCNGTESLTSRNNIFLGRPEYNTGGADLAGLYYASGATGNGDGPCASVKLNDDYSIIYGTQDNGSDCSGKAHSKCVDPKLGEALVSYYAGTAYNASLQSSSPAINAANFITGASSLDYNNFNRGTTWDIGALEYGSVSSTPTTQPTPTPTPSPSPSSAPSPTPTTTGTAVCGNGVAEDGEWCDGYDLKGQTCVSRGFKGGTLRCYACAYNTFYCYHCGNGIIDPGEDCDGGNLNGQTCASKGMGTGKLACSSCKFNTAGCSSGAPVCGNGIVEAGEQCDGKSLGGLTCASFGYMGGTLACTSTCRATLVNCNKCGNGVIDSGEWCDGNNLNGQTCVSRGFKGGTLRCYNCTFNTYYCTK